MSMSNWTEKKIKHSLVTFLLSFFINIPIVSALTIKNMDYKEGSFNIFATIPKTTDYSKPGSCWQNEGESVWQVGNNGTYGHSYLYGTEISTGMRDKGPARRICLGAVAGSQKFLTNPIRDVPECHIEFVKIEGKENGTLRATPECGYVGRCPDGDWYLKEGKTRPDCIPAAYRY